jgi:hypothetical protein
MSGHFPFMRFTPLIALFAVAAGYFLSVPLFGHKYGVLEDGRVTRILSHKDAEKCAAKSDASKKIPPPVAAEVEETSPSEAVPRNLLCELRPVKFVAWDWLHLPRAVLRQGQDMQDAAGMLTVISNVMLSNSTWELAAGTALALSSMLLLQFLWRGGQPALRRFRRI